MPPKTTAAVAVRDFADDGAIAAAIAEGFASPVIALVADARGESARALLRAGARAILPRDASRADIDAASAVVALGYTVITGGFTGTAPGDQAETLTPRERDVLAMLARGLANKRIAERLELSEHTVKFHVASILAKFGASTRTEAVTIGVRRGLVML